MTDRGGMTPIVRVVTRWLFGLIVIYGLGIALFGHLTPGGGFAGGVILACGLVLATLAFGARRGPSARTAPHASVADATGALAFLVLALLGYVAGHFFQQWAGRGALFTLPSTVTIPLMNLAILLKVGAGLFAGFMAVVLFGRLAAGGEGEEEPRQ